MGILAGKKVAIIVAMPDEFKDAVLADGHSLTICHVGKVNAAVAAARIIAEDKPDLVLNLGCAGSKKLARHAVINCTKFIQRDMDLTALGKPKFAGGSADPLGAPVLGYGIRLPEFPDGVCGTGDSFVTNMDDDYDLVEMEAYAIAKACALAGVPFLCLKFISDGADDQADVYADVLSICSDKLKEAYEGLV